MIGGLDFSVVRENLPYFFLGRYPKGPLGGVALTLYLAAISLLLSFLGGLLLGLLSVSRNRLVKWGSTAVIQSIRGMPLLMIIFWMFFLLPAMLGSGMSADWTIITALTLFTSSYMSEIVRAGILGIPKGQMEAAISTGLSHGQAMIHIILPQALRNMIPSFVNQFVSMIKDTSLAFIVGVSELTQVATQMNNRTMLYPTEIFLFIAVIYFIICFAFTELSRWLERRSPGHKTI
ncbi:MAG: amino acid ABC transporter permease [Actinomycetota bacterium]